MSFATSRLVCRVALPILAFASCHVVSDVPHYDAPTLYDTTTVRAVSFSPMGDAVLFSSDASGVFNAYSISPDGGEPAQLTSSTTDAITPAFFFPKDKRLVFEKDQGGNELAHVYVRETDGRVVDLTPGEKLTAHPMMWAGDDRSMLITSNERDPKFFDLYRYSVDGYARTLVFENKAGYELGTMSLDGHWLSLTKVNNNADNDLFLWDATKPTDAPRKITEHKGDVLYADPTFSADSREIYYTSNENGEYQTLFAQRLDTGAKRVVYATSWDVQSVACTRDGHYLVVTVNADARNEIVVKDLTTGRDLELPDLHGLDIQAFSLSRDGKRMACSAWSDTSPANVFVIDFAQRSLRQLTHTLNPAVDEHALVASEVIRFASFDGLPIPSLLYRPHNAALSERVPALLWIHGGPGGQSRTGYSPAIQHLVNHGIAVLAVNNRGSSGYGKTFNHLDDKKHGEVDLDDCVWAKKWLASQAWCDGERIGIMGGSYGGYMVLAALAFRPEEFRLGIDIFGVANWIRTLESIPPWWESYKQSLYAEMGDPVADREMLMRQSPLLHADQIRRPLLVVQGANDPRVLKVESDEIVAACKRNGVPVEYLVFPDEGHGFQKKANRIAASEAFLKFAEQYLFAPQETPGYVASVSGTH
jgi:dipeptidyl aminopeptidase/acylaminoacyl peptidase